MPPKGSSPWTMAPAYSSVRSFDAKVPQPPSYGLTHDLMKTWSFIGSGPTLSHSHKHTFLSINHNQSLSIKQARERSGWARSSR